MIPQDGACFWSPEDSSAPRHSALQKVAAGAVDPEINEVTKRVAPEAVFDEIEIQQDPSAQTAVQSWTALSGRRRHRPLYFRLYSSD